MSKLYWLWLDLLSAPFIVLGRRANAEAHLRWICPRCPTARKALRSPLGDANCYWHEAWSQGDYDIPRHFGVKNWLTQYFGYTKL